jgi:hypothetical protein
MTQLEAVETADEELRYAHATLAIANADVEATRDLIALGDLLRGVLRNIERAQAAMVDARLDDPLRGESNG